MWLRHSRISSKTYISNTKKEQPEIIDGEFKIVTYNVDCAGNNDKVVEAVAYSGADIVCLQETHRRWKKKFEQNEIVMREYPVQHWYDPPPSAGPGGIAILSKFPFVNQSLLNNTDIIEGSWFPLWSGITTINNKFLQIGIVHLRPPLDALGYKWSISSPFTTNKIRLQESKFLLDSLHQIQVELGSTKKNIPTIVLGDFNENDCGPSCSFFSSSAKMKNAVNEKIPSSIETHRFPIPNYPDYILRSRLDHLFYSENLICNHCEVIPGYEGASDHHPILGSFTFTKNATFNFE